MLPTKMKQESEDRREDRRPSRRFSVASASGIDRRPTAV
jgi:hypothetical protein